MKTKSTKISLSDVELMITYHILDKCIKNEDSSNEDIKIAKNILNKIDI